MTDRSVAATGAAPYAQRIWKVSKALDRLSVLCEQHQRQIKHVEGLPEWRVPGEPAGLPSHEPERAPPFFAWYHERESVQPLTPRSAERKRDVLRNSTKEMMAQLAPVPKTEEVVNKADLAEEKCWGNVESATIDNCTLHQVPTGHSYPVLDEKNDAPPTPVGHHEAVVKGRARRDMDSDGGPGEKPSKKGLQPVRVYPRYVRVRQGSEIRYQCGVTVEPTQVLITASDWRLPREICVTSDLNAEIRTIQIYHKIHETYDDIYSSQTIIPSVFVSVLQKEATFLFAFGSGSNIAGQLGFGDRIDRAAFELRGRRVFAWGNGDDGRLGHGNLETCLEPTPIAALVDTARFTRGVSEKKVGSDFPMIPS
ncbi:hypothetical protein P43SY_008203 [Pythium insidiosum]|uniref:Uncharacterized protein n=1 Tax=Pythium insidiosum TaxID=114742 RepID=A0AAD5Q8W6_PYTIN|nr:hypothetical protein P43SY_008203 [Pythium insidiosum]